MILDRYGQPYFAYDETLPDFNLNIKSHKVRATSRKLQANWSVADPPPKDERMNYYSAVDRLAALAYAPYRDTATFIADLPDDLIPAGVKDIALGKLLELIPKQHWPSAWGSTPLEWEDSVIGKICEVIKRRGAGRYG